MTTDQIAEMGPMPPSTEPARPEIAAVYSKLTDLEQQARTLIRQRPVVVVLAAAGLGYLVARLVSRGGR